MIMIAVGYGLVESEFQGSDPPGSWKTRKVGASGSVAQCYRITRTYPLEDTQVPHKTRLDGQLAASQLLSRVGEDLWNQPSTTPPYDKECRVLIQGSGSTVETRMLDSLS